MAVRRLEQQIEAAAKMELWLVLSLPCRVSCGRWSDGKWSGNWNAWRNGSKRPELLCQAGGDGNFARWLAPVLLRDGGPSCRAMLGDSKFACHLAESIL